MHRALCGSIAVVAVLCGSCLGAEGDATTDPHQAGPEFAVQGEYLGEIDTGGGPERCGAQVVALGDGKFHLIVFRGGLPGDGWEGRFALDTEYDMYPRYERATDDWVTGGETDQADGQMSEAVVHFERDGETATIRDGVLILNTPDGRPQGKLDRVIRQSPTLGLKPFEDAVVLFDGTTADHFDGGRMTEDGLLMVGCASRQEFRDFTLHLEFRTPFMPAAREQERGNSGTYMQDRYEIQVLDSFGLEGRANECGGLYSLAAPRLNMCYPPLSWQTYDVDFTAARFDDAGDKAANARITLRHNGVVIYDDVELPTLTPGGAPAESPGVGPLKLQEHGNPVHYRNIWVVEK